MDQEHISPKAPPEPLLAAWIKWTMDFWEAMAQMGPRLSRPGTAGGVSSAGIEETSWHPALVLWQAFFSLLSEPGTVGAVFKGINAPSEIILKMAQAGWGGYHYLYQQWLARLQPEELPAENHDFENLDQDVFKICTEIYEKEFRELLNLPQSGLTYLSPEQINGAMHRFTQFQAAMAEFIYLLYLPLKKSLRAMPGEPACEEFKEYYKRWLRLLEGHYMSLFKSREYTRTLSHALEALEDFALAKNELLANALEAFPIPTNRDMDELYREMYLLKKEIRELSKKLARLDPAPWNGPEGM